MFGVLRLLAGSPFGAMDRFGLLGAGADDRLDELAVGVLVASVHELAHGLDPVGSLVVDAAEIERGQRMVGRPDQEETGKSLANLLQRVTKRGRLEAASCSPARPRTSERPALSSWGRAGGGDGATRMTCSRAGSGRFLEQAVQARRADRRGGVSRRARVLRR